jgi:hypothetical protein
MTNPNAVRLWKTVIFGIMLSHVYASGKVLIVVTKNSEFSKTISTVFVQNIKRAYFHIYHLVLWVCFNSYTTNVYHYTCCDTTNYLTLPSLSYHGAL